MNNEFYEKAATIGQEAAVMFSQGKLPYTPEQILETVEQFHITLTIIPTSPYGEIPKIRALYDHPNRSIIVQETSLQELKQACIAAGLGPVGRVDMLAMHVAHELFHHLEETGVIPFSSYYQREIHYGKLRRILSRIYTGPPLVELREIAAHSFVTTVMGLTLSPTCLEKWI